MLVNFQVILQPGGRLLWDHVSALRTVWQSNNAIPGLAALGWERPARKQQVPRDCRIIESAALLRG